MFLWNAAIRLMQVRSVLWALVLYVAYMNHGYISNQEGPSTQYLWPFVPNNNMSMVFETRVLKYGVLGPSGQYRSYEPSAGP